MPMIVTDPRQDDNPIVFVNDAFLTLTGYGRDEIMGRNCRFLQGPETDPVEIDVLRSAVAEPTDVTVEILNYRKDGTTFWNALYMSPVFGEQGDLQFFFASQLDVTERKTRELEAVEGKSFFENAVKQRTKELEAALEQKTLLLHEVDHRVKNNLQIVAGMIRNQARFAASDETKDALTTATTRVETLGAVHQALYQSHDVSTIDIAEVAGQIAQSIVMATGRANIHVRTDLEPMVVPARFASPVALLLNEVVTNAVKHAFPDENQLGTITVSTRSDAEHRRLIIQDDGSGMPTTTPSKKTFGTRLITSLVRQLDGSMTVRSAEPGTYVEITFDTSVHSGR